MCRAMQSKCLINSRYQHTVAHTNIECKVLNSLSRNLKSVKNSYVNFSMLEWGFAYFFFKISVIYKWIISTTLLPQKLTMTATNSYFYYWWKCRVFFWVSLLVYKMSENDKIVWPTVQNPMFIYLLSKILKAENLKFVLK